MNPAGQTWQARALDLGTFAARVILAFLFLKMGLHKAFNPVEFLKLVRQYEMVSNPLVLNSIAAGLGWFEAFCALLLLTGVAVRGATLMILAMLIPFTIIVLKRALAIASAQALAFCAVKFDCGCGSGEVFICKKLVENGGLMLLAVLLLFSSSRWLCLRYSLFKPDANPLPLKV